MKSLTRLLTLTTLLLTFGTATAGAQEARDFARIPEGTVVVQVDRLPDSVRAQVLSSDGVVANVDSLSYLVRAGTVVSIRNDLAQLDRLRRLDSLRQKEARASDRVDSAQARQIRALEKQVEFYRDWQERAVEVLKDQRQQKFWRTVENVVWGAAGYGVCEAFGT